MFKFSIISEMLRKELCGQQKFQKEQKKIEFVRTLQKGNDNM